MHECQAPESALLEKFVPSTRELSSRVSARRSGAPGFKHYFCVCRCSSWCYGSGGWGGGATAAAAPCRRSREPPSGRPAVPSRGAAAAAAAVRAVPAQQPPARPAGRVAGSPVLIAPAPIPPTRRLPTHGAGQCLQPQPPRSYLIHPLLRSHSLDSRQPRGSHSHTDHTQL